jgi:hypothetical protein
MIVLNLKLDKIYGFNNFEINFTYPKKVVNSILEDEHLEGRERFRYKKAVVLMGANATGKTSLGRTLRNIFTFINTGNSAPLFEMTSEDGASFTIDFVNQGYTLHRLSLMLFKSMLGYTIRYQSSEIDKLDSYEKCVQKLTYQTDALTNTPAAMKKLFGQIEYRFAYPEIESSLKLAGTNKKALLKTLRAVVGTLDPTLQDVSLSNDLKDTFIIKRNGSEIIIQDGKLLNRELLSSGTTEGIDVAVFLASMQSGAPTFFYCDEHFSYIQSDIERRIFGLMLDRVAANGQLIFTTHNTDMLDLNLPKHAFMFLRKKLEDNEYRVSVISASDLLKRNTDSVRSAYENDMFASLPDDSLLDELEMEQSNG